MPPAGDLTERGVDDEDGKQVGETGSRAPISSGRFGTSCRLAQPTTSVSATIREQSELTPAEVVATPTLEQRPAHGDHLELAYG